MKKKKVSVLTEDWKVYHALQSFPVMLPSAPEDIHLVVFPTVAKGKRARTGGRLCMPHTGREYQPEPAEK